MRIASDVNMPRGVAVLQPLALEGLKEMIAMSVYTHRVLPWLITRACASPRIEAQRAAVVPLAEGRVLEIGAGGGLNLRHYDHQRVSRVIGLDISPPLLARAEAEAGRVGIAFEPMVLDAATIPLESMSVDSVLVTYTLCSINDLRAALREMRRVLKPGGRLIFSEHGRAPDPGVQRLQRWIEPVWKPLAGGCHLTRDPVAALRDAGFTVETLTAAYLPGTPRLVGWNSSGVAR